MKAEDNNTTTETPQVEAVSDAEDDASASETPSELDAMRADRDDLRDKFLRAQAECANISKRLTQQHQIALKTAGLDLARSMLSVLDNLDRTLDAISGQDADDALVEGIKLVRTEFVKALKDHGVAPIVAVGSAFDPMRHEAMLQDFQSDAAPGTVTQELLRGYCMHDRVIRPAKVAVAAAKPEAEKSPDGTQAPEHDEVNDADV